MKLGTVSFIIPLLCYSYFIVPTKIWYHDINRKNFLTVLKDVLKPDEDIEKKILEGTNPRYKLIIDQSEDDSATRMLIELNIVDGSKAKIFVCSDFAEESYKHVRI